MVSLWVLAYLAGVVGVVVVAASEVRRVGYISRSELLRCVSCALCPVVNWFVPVTHVLWMLHESGWLDEDVWRRKP